MRTPLAATGRDNNLNLLRMIAAVMVLISHAWPITRGPGTVEPLEASTGKTLGEIAVTVFFGLSGYLVTASWCRCPSPARFAGRRLRRLMPGLVVALILTAFVMGPLVTGLAPGAYLTARETWGFVLHNALMAPVDPDLPGVFTSAPYPAAAGSIWTLHYEVLCYAGVLAAGIAGAFVTRRHAVVWFALYTVGYGLLSQFASAGELHPRLENIRVLSLPFAIGAAAWVWRDLARLDAAVLLVLAGLAVVAAGTMAGEVLMTLAVLGAAFWAGFVPGGVLRRYNRVGDYSYGIYIYAFPVQGLVQHLYGAMTPGQNIALALAPTLVLAVLSWHLVEKPALTARFRRPAGARAA